MSAVTYRHELNLCFKKKGIKHTIKEIIIDGTKGLTFMFLKKIGENEFYKIYANESNGKYNIVEQKTTNKEDTTTSQKTETEVSKIIKSNKDLEFIKNYMEKLRGTF